MTTEDLATELFGDYDSAEEDAAAETGTKRAEASSGHVGSGGRLKRMQPEAAAEEGLFSPTVQERERKAKRRRPDVSKFFENEAEEAGAGSGDENDESDLEGLIDDSGVEPGEKGRMKLHSQIQMQQHELEEVKRDAAKRGTEGGAARVWGSSFLDRMEEKYKAMEEEEVNEEGAPASGYILAPPSPAMSLSKKETNSFIVPDAKDPKLWVTKTFAPEVELCISLMLKAGDFLERGKPVPIYSVFYSPHLRGYIYIEAWKEADVREFVKSIRGISPWNISLVPSTQMPQVFTSAWIDADKQVRLQAGDWVRLKRGPYKGDLAQIHEVRDKDYVLKLKPRLQYGIEQAAKAVDRADRESRKRPIPRWFNRADLEAGGLVVNTEKRLTPMGYQTFFLVNDDIFRDGFLFKTFKSHWFVAQDQVRPQEHEMQDWRLAPPINENTRPRADIEKISKDEDQRMMPPPSTIPKKPVERQPLIEGDIVIITKGDMKNLRCCVTKVIFGSPTVGLKPLDVDGIKGEISIAVTSVSKYFAVGDYVKALGGEHKGETGTVTKVLLDAGGEWGPTAAALVLRSSACGEFKVWIDHIRLTSERSDPQDVIGEFKIEQLVRMEGRANTRGIIVRLEADSSATVLTPDGARTTVSIAELHPVTLPPKKRYVDTTWTIDRKGQKIFPMSVVKCPRSVAPAAPIKAEVLHIHGNTCFLKAQEMFTGERAYLVCSGQKCEYVWSKDESKMMEQKNLLIQTETKEPKTQYGIVMASETDWLSPWFKKMMGIEDSAAGSRPAIYNNITVKGTGVRITGGAYKGLRGEIRDFLGDTVRVSLLAKPKLVTVSVNNIALDDYLKKPGERQPSMAPKTPTGHVLHPASPALAPLEDEEQELDDENSWDPNFLLPTPPKETMENTPALPPIPEPPTETKPTSSRSKPASTRSDTEEFSGDRMPHMRKKRRTRIPHDTISTSHDAVENSSSPTGHSDKISESANVNTESPSALFGRTSSAKSEPRESWLIEGVGVKYTHNGQLCNGWIVKVYHDTAHVVPDTFSVEEFANDDNAMLTLKGNETQPWLCEKRGDFVLVFDGSRSGAKGKVIGFEAVCAYIRAETEDKGKHTLLFASASGGDLVRVEKKHITRYSPEWAKAVTSMAGKARPLRSMGDDAPAAGDGDAPRKAPWWEEAGDLREASSDLQSSGAQLGVADGESEKIDGPRVPTTPPGLGTESSQVSSRGEAENLTSQGLDEGVPKDIGTATTQSIVEKEEDEQGLHKEAKSPLVEGGRSPHTKEPLTPPGNIGLSTPLSGGLTTPKGAESVAPEGNIPSPTGEAPTPGEALGEGQDDETPLLQEQMLEAAEAADSNEKMEETAKPSTRRRLKGKEAPR